MVGTNAHPLSSNDLVENRPRTDCGAVIHCRNKGVTSERLGERDYNE